MYLKIPLVRQAAVAIPAMTSSHAAGFDLCANLDGPTTLAPGQRTLIPTGLMMSIPQGFCGLVSPRSDLALTHGITILNAPGVIEPDHRGDIGIILANFGDNDFIVTPGMYVAQIVFIHYMKTLFIPSTALLEADRG